MSGSVARESLLVLVRLTSYVQIVLHTEGAGNPIRSDESDVSIRSGVDNSVKLHMTILYRDTNGLSRVDGVSAERRMPVYRTCHRHASVIARQS